MKPNTIRIPMSQKLWVGGYETINPAVELEAEIEPGEDPGVAYRAVHAMVQAMWREEAILILQAVIQRKHATGQDYALAQATLVHLSSQP